MCKEVFGNYGYKKKKSVPVIFEPPCIQQGQQNTIYTIMFMTTLYKDSTEAALTQVIKCYNRKDF
jgi:hypothetical protein